MGKEKRNIKEFGGLTGRINVFFENQKTQRRGGFTLIEVLVVVLIIGILTSIALPQYTKAVEKARAAEGLQIAKQIHNAQQIFHTTYGRWATQDDWDALDIDISGTGAKSAGYGRPTTPYFSYAPHGGGDTELTVVQRLPENGRYYFIVYEDNPDRIVCVAVSSQKIDQEICRQFNQTGTL